VASKENKKKKIDVGLVGEVVRIDPEIIQLLDSRDFIPVIAPIGSDETRRRLQHQRRHRRGQARGDPAGEKFILLTNTTGVMDKEGKVVTGLTAQKVREMIDDGTISGGMLPKVECALDAVRNGVKSAHIIDGRVSHALLLEVLTSSGGGHHGARRRRQPRVALALRATGA
jgi:acetylglutamate kinase